MSKLTDLLEEHTAEAVYETLLELRNGLEKYINTTTVLSEEARRGAWNALGFVDGFVDRRNPDEEDE